MEFCIPTRSPLIGKEWNLRAEESKGGGGVEYNIIYVVVRSKK